MQLCALDDVTNPATKFSILRNLALRAHGVEMPEITQFDDFVIMAMVLKKEEANDQTCYRRIGLVVDIDPYWLENADTKMVIVV